MTIYTPAGLIKDMDFQPLRLFDGALESAWAESASGDVIGEWVEIELTRDVVGFQVQNGFSMSFTPAEGKTIDTCSEKNNRVHAPEIAFLPASDAVTKVLAEDAFLKSSY